MRRRILFITVFLSNFIMAQNDLSRHMIVFDSQPQGAKIFIDDEFIGNTPITFENPNRERMNIRAFINEELQETRTFMYLGGKQDVFFVLDGNYGLLDVVSSPIGAEIFVNDSLIGKAPIANKILAIGVNKIKIHKEDYVDVEKTIRVTTTKYKYNFELEYKYGFITNKSERNDISLLYNNETIDFPINNYRVPIGLQNILILDSKNKKRTTKEISIESSKEYTINVDYNFFTMKYFLFSSLIPGLGQFLNDAKIKGVGIFSTTLIGSLLYLAEQSNYDKKLGDYNRLKQTYLNVGTEAEAIELSAQLGNSLDHVNNSADKKNLYVKGLLGIYALNLIDAILFHSRDSSIDLVPFTNNETETVGLNLSLSF